MARRDAAPSRRSGATTRSTSIWWRASGRDGISDLIGAVQQQVPGHVFKLVGDHVDDHHNVVRFSWELVPAIGGESLAIGFDVAVTGDDERIGSVVGFLDKAPVA